MRLTKVQKFLKENNIDYDITVDNIKSNEFANIYINSNKTNYKSISEITGIRGNSVSGIRLLYKNQENNKSYSITLTSQDDIISRLKNDIINIRKSFTSNFI